MDFPRKRAHDCAFFIILRKHNLTTKEALHQANRCGSDDSMLKAQCAFNASSAASAYSASVISHLEGFRLYGTPNAGKVSSVWRVWGCAALQT
ncbi:hypothetical protein HMPREF3208_01239 [Gardnerella vaginalis]|uniref:Uncharacterized protein n=1 Tax=Gardnerella vaginalis TaxID=2702 RepID=A0A133NS32_GARVA|nr:hypothetical protein HMPREF3208_01239 [Gardnerella vaginalis]